MNARVLLLITLCLAGLGLRLTGVDYGLPCREEMDAEIVTQVQHMRGRELDLDRSIKYGTYPLLIAKLTVLVTGATKPEPIPVDSPREDHLRAAAITWIQIRTVVAVLSALIVPATWLLARRFLPPAESLLAVALVAFSPLHLFFSQQVRPHSPSSTFYLLAVLAAMWLRRRPTALTYGVAGLAAGGALGCLQSGAAVLSSTAAAHLLRSGTRGVGWLRSLWDPRILIALAVVLACVRYFYSFYFETHIELSGVQEEASLEGERLTVAGHEINLANFNGAGFPYLLGKMWSYELATLVLLGLATVVFGRRLIRGAIPWRELDRDLLVAAAFALPYLFVIGIFEDSYERFLIPLLPFFACFGAWGAGTVVRAMPAGGARKSAIAGTLALLLLTATVGAKLAWLRSSPDTMDRAATWIEQNLDPDSDKVHLATTLGLPLSRQKHNLSRKAAGHLTFNRFSKWTTYLARMEGKLGPPPRYDVSWMVPDFGRFEAKDPNSLHAYLESVGPGYFVIEAKSYGHLWMPYLVETLSRMGPRVARFSPDAGDAGWEYPLLYQDEDKQTGDWPHMTWRILCAQSIGPVIEIYEFAPSQSDG